jgi:anti-anti-sigma factor
MRPLTAASVWLQTTRSTAKGYRHLGRAREPLEATVTAKDEWLSISVKEGESGPVVLLVGELDMDGANRAEAALFYALHEHGPVVADLSRLTFIDSCGLRSLVLARRRLRQAGSDLVIRDPSGPVTRVLEIEYPHEFLIERDGHQ